MDLIEMKKNKFKMMLDNPQEPGLYNLKKQKSKEQELKITTDILPPPMYLAVS
jgi:hypothetical protein